MDIDDLERFGEATRAADKRRALDLADLSEAGGLLAEVTRAAALANHLQAEAAALSGRYILRDDTGGGPPTARDEEGKRRTSSEPGSLRGEPGQGRGAVRCGVELWRISRVEVWRRRCQRRSGVVSPKNC
jgi:hypothetical protein